MTDLTESFTVGTPTVKSRSEAWLAWTSANLAKYKHKPRPANNFWRRWKRIRGDWYDFEQVKQYTGELSIKAFDDTTLTFNLLEKKEIDWRPGFLFTTAPVSERYPDLRDAQAWFRKKVYGGLTHEQFLADQTRFPGSHFTIENVLLIAKKPILKEAVHVNFCLRPEERQLALSIAKEKGSEPGIRIWTDEGLHVVPLHHEVQAYYLDGILGNTLQALYDGLEQRGKVEPLV